MTKTKNIKKNIALDLTTYFNGDTGESLASELVNMEVKTTVSIMEDTGLVTRGKMENFAVIDTDVVTKIMDLISRSDLGHVMVLATLTKTELNMVYNNTIPHTNSSLQKYLKISNKSSFHKIINRLIKAGILYQMKGNIYGKVRVVYIMNPYISSRRKTFCKKLFEVFKDFK